MLKKRNIVFYAGGEQNALQYSVKTQVTILLV